jgi:alpha 1,2-mannosyltransferase
MFSLNIVYRTIRELVKPSFCGDGIVIVAGGETYFINAFLNIRLLRYLGCQLPIQWFYFEDELTTKQKELVAEIIDVELVELKRFTTASSNVRGNGGYQAKFFAIAQSDFQNIIYLDADNFSILDPTFLLSDENFLKYGVIMWYDCFSWEYYESSFGKDITILKRVFNTVRFDTPRTFETGQLVINKDKVWDALAFAVELNRWWHFIYKNSLGDKETLYLGCEMADTPYYIVGRFPTLVKNAFKQFAPDCTTHLFSHCVRSKWTKRPSPMTDNTILPHLNEMKKWHRELLQKI